MGTRELPEKNYELCFCLVLPLFQSCSGPPDCAGQAGPGENSTARLCAPLRRARLIAVPAPARCALPGSAGRGGRPGKAQSLPGSSSAPVPGEPAERSSSDAVNGNSAQSAKKAWLRGENCSNLNFI